MSVHGVGKYVPYKGYVCRRDGKITAEYGVWAGMLARCYTDRYPTYKNCYVNDVWHKSDDFWKWAEIQVGFLTDSYCLDKDILVEGNKEYGPNTCAFVPKNLNQFLCGADAIRGNLPKGVFYDLRRSKFVAKISIDNRTVNLGRFEELEDAKLAYSAAKTAEGRRWAVRLTTEGYSVDSRIVEVMRKYEFKY